MKAVEIPKAGGNGVRVLGVPTVADRVAQTVARMYLEPLVEPIFHPDSYGYRPRQVRAGRGRSVPAAVLAGGLGDRSGHPGVLRHRALRPRAEGGRPPSPDQRWILLYVQRWLQAPLQQADGTLVARDRGTPQGSAISPLLANLFMHYAFDAWMVREFPAVQFERYCDDVVVHCAQRVPGPAGSGTRSLLA